MGAWAAGLFSPCVPLYASATQAEAAQEKVAADLARLENAFTAEQELLAKATALAAAGYYDEALRLITRRPSLPGVMQAEAAAQRVYVVAGFLRNQSKYAEADQFAKLALAAPVFAVDKKRASAERTASRHWRARLLSDVVGDHAAALRCLEASESDEAPSAETTALRSKLEKIRPARR